MAGPTKPYDPADVKNQLGHNYDFTAKLFGQGQQAFRNTFFNCTTEAALRALLLAEKITVAADVRIMLVDVENARSKTFGPIDASNEKFYVLVMAPVPRGDGRPAANPPAVDPGYIDMQAWENAWYHAIVDGYGM